MRYLALSSLIWLTCAACSDDDPDAPQRTPDSGTSAERKDAGRTVDASTQGRSDAGVVESGALPRPGLPRPPNGLPVELRPPR